MNSMTELSIHVYWSSKNLIQIIKFLRLVDQFNELIEPVCYRALFKTVKSLTVTKLINQFYGGIEPARNRSY